MRILTTAAILLATAIPVGVLGSVPAHAQEPEITVSPDGSRTPAAGAPDNFTGAVVNKPLFDMTDYSNTSGGQVTFTPGARTAWHTHPAGQTLIV